MIKRIDDGRSEWEPWGAGCCHQLLLAIVEACAALLLPWRRCFERQVALHVSMKHSGFSRPLTPHCKCCLSSQLSEPLLPLPPTPCAGRKKRKGAGGSDSDSDGGADSPDGLRAGTLTLAQPQQGLADLAQKFMAMLTTVRSGGQVVVRSRRGRRCSCLVAVAFLPAARSQKCCACAALAAAPWVGRELLGGALPCCASMHLFDGVVPLLTHAVPTHPNRLQDPRSSAKPGRAGSRRGGRDAGQRHGGGPIIEEAPAASNSGPGGGVAGAAAIPTITSMPVGGAAAAAAAGGSAPILMGGPGGMYDAAAAAAAGGMGVSPLPPGVYDPSTAFMGVPPVADFVPLPGGAGGAPGVGSPLQQMPLPIPTGVGMVPGMNGVTAGVPPVTDSNPIVELPDPLEGLSLGGVDLVRVWWGCLVLVGFGCGL